MQTLLIITSLVSTTIFFTWFVETDSLIQSYATCAEWMENRAFGSLNDGVYTVKDTSNNRFISAYCNFNYDQNYSFTLIESGSRVNMSSTSILAEEPFYTNQTYSMNNVDTARFSAYRLSLSWMKYLQSKSDYLFATCNFNTQFTRDWVLINLNNLPDDENPFEKKLNYKCVEVVSVNIRGNTCTNNTIIFYQWNAGHLEIDTSDETNSQECGCWSYFVDGSVDSEDNFGYYDHFNTNFSCTHKNTSTTNWWLGAKVNTFNDGKFNGTTSYTPTQDPAARLTVAPTIIPTIMPSVEEDDLINTTSEEIIRTSNIDDNYNTSYSSSGHGGGRGSGSGSGSGNGTDSNTILFVIVFAVLIFILLLLVVIIVGLKKFIHKKHERFDRLLENINDKPNEKSGEKGQMDYNYENGMELVNANANNVDKDYNYNYNYNPPIVLPSHNVSTVDSIFDEGSGARSGAGSGVSSGVSSGVAEGQITGTMNNNGNYNKNGAAQASPVNDKIGMDNIDEPGSPAFVASEYNDSEEMKLKEEKTAGDFSYDVRDQLGVDNAVMQDIVHHMSTAQ